MCVPEHMYVCARLVETKREHHIKWSWSNRQSELSDMGTRTNPKEKRMPSTAEPSLQPQHLYFIQRYKNLEVIQNI